MREAPGGGGEDGAGDQARTSDRRRASCDDETCCDDVGARACAANDGDGREASSRGVLARESIRERFVTRFVSRPNEIATAVTRRGATPARTTMRPRETLWLCAFLVACVAATARAEMFLPRFLSHSGETKPTHNDHPRRLARADPLASAGHDVLARPDDASRDATPSTRPPPPPTPATPLDSRPADANADPNLSAAAPVRTRAVTWGVGGDRLGRPSDPRPVPPAPVEGIPANESVVWAAASGHTALVTDVGHLYTAGRNDSAGGAATGRPLCATPASWAAEVTSPRSRSSRPTSPRAAGCVRPSLVRTIPHRRCHRARRRANLRPERSRPTRPRGRRGRVDERRVFVRLGRGLRVRETLGVRGSRRAGRAVPRRRRVSATASRGRWT